MSRLLKIFIAIAVASSLAMLAYIWLFSTQMPTVRLAVTTSVYDSGLLDAIIPLFEEKYGIRVMVIPVGSGQALNLAKRGEVDVVITHLKDQEINFIESGFGIHRIGLMYNDFIIAGPRDDPAGISGLRSAAEAFQRIAESKSMFISRADFSGTYMAELSVWRSIGLMPDPRVDSWYVEAGRGMGSLLRMADEVGAYTIVDRATWLSYRRQMVRLAALVICDPPFYNPYSLILVNPESNPHVNYKPALMLATFLVSREGQEIIGGFKKDGEVIFKPLSFDFGLAREMGYPKQEEELAWYLSQKIETYGRSSESMLPRGVFVWEVLGITALSLQVSLTSVAIGSAIGVPLGALLGLKRFSRKRVISRLIETAVKTSMNTLMGLPPVVAGLIIFLLFNRSGPLGFLGLLYTPTAMILTQVILVTPIVVGVTMSAVAEVKEAVRERALSLGATERQAAWVVVKEARGGIIMAIIVAFGAAISEVGGIMIAGGNIRWHTRTLTTAIITEVELGNFEMALTLGIILLGIAFAINLALTIIQMKAKGYVK